MQGGFNRHISIIRLAGLTLLALCFVQPQVQALSITVRGPPDRFADARLELKVDRPGYTRFKLQRSEDMPEALKIIGQSKRKEIR